MTQASMSTSRALFYSLAFGTALSLMPASAMAVQGGQCNNGIDDDGDGLVDYLYDMGCYGPDDPTEEGLPRNQENGWTTFNKSDTRIVYVSDSQGWDANTGLCPNRAQVPNPGQCGPKKTLAAGYRLLRDGKADWLLLHRGDTWKNQNFSSFTQWNNSGGTYQDFWRKGGASPTQMMVLGAYGSAAARPKIESGNAVGLRATQVKNLAIVGIEFSDDRRNPASSRFRTEGVNAGSPQAIQMIYGMENILIEDVLALNSWISVEGSNATGQPAPGCWNNIANITIRRNVIAYSYTTAGHMQGIFTYGGSNTPCLFPGSPPTGGAQLIEENVINQAGWYDPTLFPGSVAPTLLDGNPNDVDDATAQAQATIYNHGMYLSGGYGNTVVRNNIIYRPSATGVQLRMGGMILGNVVLDAPIGLTIGHAQNPLGTVTTGEIANNLVLGSRNIRADEPRGSGIVLGGAAVERARVHNNVIAHHTNSTGTVQAIALAGLGAPGTEERSIDNEIFNNVVFNWSRSGTGGTAFANNIADINRVDGVRVYNNTFQQPVAGNVIHNVNANSVNGVLYSNNRHFANASLAFRIASSSLNFANWASYANETGSSFAPVALPDSSRNVATYMQSIGLSGDKRAFVERAMQQSRFNYDPRFTAPALNNYVRAGFGLPPVPATVTVAAANAPTTQVSMGGATGLPVLQGLVTSDDLPVYQLNQENQLLMSPPATTATTGNVLPQPLDTSKLPVYQGPGLSSEEGAPVAAPLTSAVKASAKGEVKLTKTPRAKTE